MKRISFGITLAQFEDGSKDVTRRLGWKTLKPGDHLLAVDRVMGFKKGQKARILGEIEVVEVNREPLCWITNAEVEREGFPGRSPEWFVEMFCKAMKCDHDTTVTRIVFLRVAP